ncbi:MAG: hypothetical protein L6282_02240 [Candidatus Methanoperedenaceae archaeon]|nr:hypothetical protein [Candidatus Methanoperedenaceae archaeon]
MKWNMTGSVCARTARPEVWGGDPVNCAASRPLVHPGFEVVHVERLPCISTVAVCCEMGSLCSDKEW